jgi:hypothetical protein
LTSVLLPLDEAIATATEAAANEPARELGAVAATPGAVRGQRSAGMVAAAAALCGCGCSPTRATAPRSANAIAKATRQEDSAKHKLSNQKTMRPLASSAIDRGGSGHARASRLAD